MSDNEPEIRQTQHALLVAWGIFAEEIGLIKGIEEVKLKQKQYWHKPQTKVLEFLVATLGGVRHLQEISHAAHPLDQDQTVAWAWGQEQWADYSGVSRSLKSLSWEEVEQIRQQLQLISQPFIDAEVALSLKQQQRLIYDGDLTGLAVCKSSQTYPEVAYGYMDDQICLGYQAAVVSFYSPSYQRLWLSVQHHPGNTVAASQAEALVQAAEKATGVRPRRRVELLAQRLQQVVSYGETLQQRLTERQQKWQQAQAEAQAVAQQLQLYQQQLLEMEQQYHRNQRQERPTNRLAQTRKKVLSYQKRHQRRQQALTKAQERVEDNQQLLARQHLQQVKLERRLAQFRQENSHNPNPIQAVFRLDAGFGTYENLALLIELGYEVYTKVQNHQVVKNLQAQLPPQAPWTPVAQKAAMLAWADKTLESFVYPLDVGLAQFTTDDQVKYSAMLHFGPDPVTEDLPGWFHFYNRRQAVEAGIKESKHLFQLHRLKVRSGPAIALQALFVTFAANFIRWSQLWLTQQLPALSSEQLYLPDLSLKQLVQVAAHTSAEVICSSAGKLLRFSEQSVFAGKILRLQGHALQLPLPFFKSCLFSPV